MVFHRKYADRMPIANVFTVTVSGPKEDEAMLVNALTRSGFAAEVCAPYIDQEADLGWVRVLTHEGHDGPPSPEFQQEVMARAGGIATAYSYSQRASGITIGT